MIQWNKDGSATLELSGGVSFITDAERKTLSPETLAILNEQRLMRWSIIEALGDNTRAMVRLTAAIENLLSSVEA